VLVIWTTLCFWISSSLSSSACLCLSHGGQTCFLAKMDAHQPGKGVYKEPFAVTTYTKAWWGFTSLWRWQYSIIPRTFPFAFTAIAVTVVLHTLEDDTQEKIREAWRHPYPFQAFAFVVGFVIVFRCDDMLMSRDPAPALTRTSIVPCFNRPFACKGNLHHQISSC
jgi:hypothetical protein